MLKTSHIPNVFPFTSNILTLGLALTAPIVHSETFPKYSQQCRDDAGPPFADDADTYCGNKYHFGSSATPSLPTSGECSAPIKEACDSVGAKQAHIEGPIDCGGNGWYCRILVDDNWPSENLVPDLNFGYCNTTEGFNDQGYDKSGHCHGSDNDSTYYWWMRDHWFRGYNGRLRCCCGWYQGGADPVTQGRITNRCDYRRLVVDEDDASSCRDANEDHGLGFEGGCDSKYKDNVGLPLVEDDSQCWELLNFGYNEADYTDVDCEGGGGEGGEEEEEEEEGEEEEEEEEDCFNDGEDEEEEENEEEDEEDKRKKKIRKKALKYLRQSLLHSR